MNLKVTDNLIKIEAVYMPIILVTDKGETLYIVMRDGGFEFNYNGVPHRAVGGVLSEVIPSQPNQTSEAENFTTVNGLTARRNPDNDYMKVAERLYYEQNPDSKMDVPNMAYEMAERWHKEFRDDNTWVGTFYNWCIEYKRPKERDHSNDESVAKSGN